MCSRILENGWVNIRGTFRSDRYWLKLFILMTSVSIFLIADLAFLEGCVLHGSPLKRKKKYWSQFSMDGRQKIVDLYFIFIFFGSKGTKAHLDPILS